MVTNRSPLGGCDPSAKPPTHNFQTTSTVGPKSDKKDSKTMYPTTLLSELRRVTRDSHNSFREFCRRISTPRLHALLRFHLVPINVVISHEPQTIPDLGVGFPLRCFQRLSFPDIATGRCHWCDSPQTRGQFMRVLSYYARISSRINACSRLRPTCLTHVGSLFESPISNKVFTYY